MTRTVTREAVLRVFKSDGAPMTAQDVRDALGIEGGNIGTILCQLAAIGTLVRGEGDSPRKSTYTLAPNGVQAMNASRAPRTGDVPRRTVPSLQPAPTHTGDSPERRALILAAPPPH